MKATRGTVDAIGGLIILGGFLFLVLQMFLSIGNALSGGGSGGSLCVQRGVAYFRESGAHPRLSDGRDATDVAYAMCARDSEAFGSAIN